MPAALCKKKFVIFALFLLWAIMPTAQTHADSGSIYSVHPVSRLIRRSDLSAPSAQTLIGPSTTGLFSTARGFAIDAFNAKIYWTQADMGFIGRANLSNGQNFELLSGVASTPGAIAIDVQHNRLFYALPTQGGIVRANLNGSNQVGIISGQAAPDHLALDIPAQHIYWTDPALHKIRRANFDGSNIVDVVNIGLNEQPMGLALDLVNRRIFWTDFALGTIKVASLSSIPANGLPIVSGLSSPTDVALDLGASIPKLYFVSKVNAVNQFFAFVTNLAKPDKGQEIGDAEQRSLLALDLPCSSFSLDSDGDAIPDCQDLCPSDGNKSTPLICGCGASEADRDQDSLPDCIDACPNTPSVLLPDTTPFCPQGPVLNPSTIISEPPLVIVRNRNATVLLQNFAAVTDNVSVNEAARRLAIKYDVRLQSKNTLSAELRAKTIKRNKIVYRNLAPATYSVKYRALINRNKRTVARTKFSPKAKFVIR